MVVALYSAILEFNDPEYVITFPDLAGCRAVGGTQDGAVCNGLAALTLWIEKKPRPATSRPSRHRSTGCRPNAACTKSRACC